MNVGRTTTINISLNSLEVIAMLKKTFPHDLSIQALPNNPNVGRGTVTSTVVGSCGLAVVYTCNTDFAAVGE